MKKNKQNRNGHVCVFYRLISHRLALGGGFTIFDTFGGNASPLCTLLLRFYRMTLVFLKCF